MEGYSAIVTGGAQSIGRAIAAALAGAGMQVVIIDSDAVAGREAEQELTPASARFIHGDAGNPAVLRRAVALARKLGGGLHAAVANAGFSTPKAPAQLTLQEWNRVLALNLTGAFLLAKQAEAELRRTRGAILNIASTRALMSEPGWEAYAASKGGIVALTHALSLSLAPDVRVNCISPGWIATEGWQKGSARKPPKLSKRDHLQHPAGRVGRPEDIGALARFLLSPQAGFITGANYVADGGMTRKMIYA